VDIPNHQSVGDQRTQYFFFGAITCDLRLDLFDSICIGQINAGAVAHGDFFMVFSLHLDNYSLFKVVNQLLGAV
jgi:hypothetical protein